MRILSVLFVQTIEVPMLDSMAPGLEYERLSIYYFVLFLVVFALISHRVDHIVSELKAASFFNEL
jgi:hypothetical protein